tara:strand:+ start:145 stop:408 length:264 start_codon:yes stop_codon:yes gene_type:complete
MSKLIKKFIKPDKNKTGSQVVISIKENDIHVAINQSSGISQIDLTYNQLCSLSKAINSAIDQHYQEYSSCMTQEKTQKIYIDDPIDW